MAKWERGGGKGARRKRPLGKHWGVRGREGGRKGREKGKDGERERERERVALSAVVKHSMMGLMREERETGRESVCEREKAVLLTIKK